MNNANIERVPLYGYSFEDKKEKSNAKKRDKTVQGVATTSKVDMNLYDERFLYTRWNDKLKPEFVFVANDLETLRRVVENEDNRMKGTLEPSGGIEKPFLRPYNGIRYRYAYFDPLYSYKQAYKAGKKVYYNNREAREWLEVEDGHDWDDLEEYRIADKMTEEDDHMYTENMCKERMNVAQQRLTCGQLAMWLAKGNGQYMYEGTDNARTEYVVYIGKEGYFVPESILVRKWDTQIWHQPTVGYCFPEAISPTPDEIGG